MAWNRAAGAATQNRQSRQPRRHARVAVCNRVRLVASENRKAVHILDVSAGGCSARIHARLEAGLAVRVELVIDGDPTWFPGRVVWTKTTAGAFLIGVRFEHLDPTIAHNLREFVARQQSRRLF